MYVCVCVCGIQDETCSSGSKINKTALPLIPSLSLLSHFSIWLWLWLKLKRYTKFGIRWDCPTISHSLALLLTKDVLWLIP